MIRRTLTTLLILGTAACGEDGLSLEDIVGTYTLQTIDGEALPWTAPQTGGTSTLEITAGHVNLDALRTCTNNITYRETADGDVTTETVIDPCQYTFVDGILTMTFPTTERALNASIVGSLLSYSTSGNLFVFGK